VNEKWNKLSVVPSSTVQELAAFIDQIRDYVNNVTSIMKIALTAAKIALTALQEKLNLLESLINELEKMINDFLDSLTASGGYFCYFLPDEYKNVDAFLKAISSTILTEKDWEKNAIFSSSEKTALNFNRNRYVPKFKKLDFVGGYAIILTVINDFSEIERLYDDFRKLASLFNLPDITGFDHDFYLRFAWVDPVSRDAIHLIWNSPDYPHRVEFEFEELTPDDRSTKTSKAFKGSGSHATSEYALPVTAGNIYIIRAKLYETEGGTLVAQVKKHFEIPEGYLWDHLGNIGDKQWFGVSLDSLFPEVYILKRWLQDQVSFYLNRYKKPKNAIDEAIDALLKQTDTILQQIEEVELLFNNFLDKLKALSESQGFYKKIDYKIGGNQRFIKELKNKTGIHKIYSQTSIWGACFMVMYGAAVDANGQTSFTENKQFGELLGQFFSSKNYQENYEDTEKKFIQANKSIKGEKKGFKKKYNS